MYWLPLAFSYPAWKFLKDLQTGKIAKLIFFDNQVCPCNKIHKVKGIDLSFSKYVYCLENFDVWDYVKCKAILYIINFFANTRWVKF